MTAQKQRCIGLLAHVDAGKTTLAEAMLYLSGTLKRLGRVDHRDSFLDTHTLERERGITIFSKQAILDWNKGRFTLLDTPGHADFSAEMERTLRVLDCAVLVISGPDGPQAHTETLWRLLKRYRVPCFLFASKMDLPGADRAAVMEKLQKLDEHCVDFNADTPQRDEQIAMCSEEAMECYLDGRSFADERIRSLIVRRELFPCFFGSGLRLDGVDSLLDALDRYAPETEDRGNFAARVFKIARDSQGNRLTFLKVTGGALKVRSGLDYTGEDGKSHQEKITQLRLYSGLKFETTDAVSCGQICAALGLSESYPGQGLGEEPEAELPVLEPVLSHRVLLPEGVDPALMLPKLRLLQEEDPLLHILWNSRTREIGVSLMGRVQTEVFQRLVKERFDVDVGLDRGRILYRATIVDKVEGVGHFEPLRHYAEVHLLLEPLPAGSGIVLDTICSEDTLDRNWQRLILTHLQEKQHLGVLSGSPITDIKITLAAGRAHLKHTEGGDFREATYRAVRQGLMQAKSILLEPWYAFVLEVPVDQIGRAISDVRMMNGEFDSPEDAGDMLRLTGSAPVSAMNGYLNDLLGYTHGRGRLSLRLNGYRPVKDQPALVRELGYDAEADLDNTADSVFCAHGGGFTVKWDKVSEYMHLPSVLRPQQKSAPVPERRNSFDIDERELEAIMEREFGPIRRPQYQSPARNEAPRREISAEEKRETIIVDGYNLIYAWDELKTLAQERMDLARTRLQDLLSSYCGYTRAEIVLVFDAYRTPGNPGSHEEYHNIRVAYTKDGETGDAYIERIVDEIGKNYRVRVVTSDNLIRLSALRSGVLRTSSKEFAAEVEWVLNQIEAVLKKTNEAAHTTRVKDGKP